MGELHGAPIAFESVEDVPCGGVLLALPALLQNGLLAHSRELFSMPEGYYPLESIFLLLAFMALARIPSLEALRYQAPGEWGKVLGLDRIPEVRTLRAKLSALCSQTGQASTWSGILAKEWMEVQAPQAAGVFYADGWSTTIIPPHLATVIIPHSLEHAVLWFLLVSCADPVWPSSAICRSEARRPLRRSGCGVAAESRRRPANCSREGGDGQRGLFSCFVAPLLFRWLSPPNSRITL